MNTTITILQNNDPVWLPVNIAETLLDRLYAFTCDCGARPVWLHRFPYRCLDCGEWFWTPGHVDVCEKFEDLPKLEVL